MEVNDVRVGNWVHGGAQMKIYQVTNVHIADLITIQNDEEEVECLSDRVYPIELTDDLLAKIGFKYKDGCFNRAGFEIYEQMGKYYPYDYWEGIIIGREIEGLHHLQNLFYMLKGEELNIEL